jgi:hypothetical protein
MSNHFSYKFFMITLVLYLSCSKETVIENNSSSKSSYIKFKLDGKEVILDSVNIIYNDSADGSSEISGLQKNGPALLVILLDHFKFTEGSTHSLIDPNKLVFFTYRKDTLNFSTDIYSITSDAQCKGSITINKRKLLLDGLPNRYAINGIFSAVAVNGNNKAISFSDGEIYDKRVN